MGEVERGLFDAFLQFVNSQHGNDWAPMLDALGPALGIYRSELSCRCYCCFRCCPADSDEVQAACSVAAGCYCHPAEVDDCRRYPEVVAGCHLLVAAAGCRRLAVAVDCHPVVADAAAVGDDHLAAAVCHRVDVQAGAVDAAAA